MHATLTRASPSADRLPARWPRTRRGGAPMLDRFRARDAARPARVRSRRRCARCDGRIAVYRPGTALYACLACLDCGAVAFAPLGEATVDPRQPSTS